MIEASSNNNVKRVWILGDLHFGVRANSQEWLDIQKDFHDPDFWFGEDHKVEPLVMGIWEFKEQAEELGFQVGIG